MKDIPFYYEGQQELSRLQVSAKGWSWTTKEYAMCLATLGTGCVVKYGWNICGRNTDFFPRLKGV